MSAPLLAVDGLRVELASGVAIVEDVSLRVDAGQILGIVGESGSGKTTLALALLGAAAPGARIAAGAVTVAGQAMTGRPEAQVRRLRGRLVSFVAQEPGEALNPAIRVGRQIGELLAVHTPRRDCRAGIAQALASVRLPSDRGFQRRFPHQLSGGQQQRVALAQAFVCEPSLVVLDEPTTGLDVVTQALLLAEIRRLGDTTGTAIVYISHDLAVVATLADRIAVMYAGHIVEEGPTAALLARPAHPYTAGLLGCLPSASGARVRPLPGIVPPLGQRGHGCPFAPRCPQRRPACADAVPPMTQVGGGRGVRCIAWDETALVVRAAMPSRPPAVVATASLLRVERLTAVHRTRSRTVFAARDVSFSIAAGECVALIGASGSGKTTIARCVVGLQRPTTGAVLLDGQPLAAGAAARTAAQRRRVQMVFQNPAESLNPRHTAGASIARAARLLRGLSPAEARAEAARLLEQVRLPGSTSMRYPSALSGGERQRVAIARALAGRPDVLVCDEITSSLDVSVQAAILELLDDLRATLGLSLLFISHDLRVVASVADRVVVLADGAVAEQGPVSDILGRLTHPHTRGLAAAAPGAQESPWRESMQT